MILRSFASESYKPQFSGHETFPLRYGWLKKAYDAVDRCGSKSVFVNDDAIARFGVGKNMVTSMRHWAQSCGIISEDDGDNFSPTPIGEMVFSKDGVDPYMENPSTLWLIHWFLSSRPNKTTCYWAFNHFHSSTFERENLVQGLIELAKAQQWGRAAAATIKRDVECFVRLYASKVTSAKGSHEDALESPLAELGLIRSTGRLDGFRFVRGNKPTLNNEILLYALMDFWDQQSIDQDGGKAETISFERIAHDPGSPGRVFLLSEDDLYGRVQNVEDISEGAIQWSETAGLKQLIRREEIEPKKIIRIVRSGYRVHETEERA